MNTAGSSEEGTIPFDRELEHGGAKTKSRKHLTENNLQKIGVRYYTSGKTQKRLCSTVTKANEKDFKYERLCSTVTKANEKDFKYERLGIFRYGNDDGIWEGGRGDGKRWRREKVRLAFDEMAGTKEEKRRIPVEEDPQKRYAKGGQGQRPFSAARALPLLPNAHNPNFQ